MTRKFVTTSIVFTFCVNFLFSENAFVKLFDTQSNIKEQGVLMVIFQEDVFLWNPKILAYYPTHGKFDSAGNGIMGKSFKGLHDSFLIQGKPKEDKDSDSLDYRDWVDGTRTSLRCYFDRSRTLTQSTIPFISSDKEWIVNYESFTSLVDNGIRTYSFKNTADTINGKLYNQLRYYTPANPSMVNTNFFYREEDGILYQYQAGSDKLIYNFNLQVGDTLIRHPSQPLFNLKVVKIDTVAFNDLTPRKRLTLECESENNRHYYWIEGMGGDETFLDTDICTIFDGPKLLLRCFFENGVKVYQDSLVTDCLISGSNDVPQWDNIKIYPNPTTSEVTITTPLATTLRILDVYGKLYSKLDISEGQNSINLTELPSGILIFVVGNQRFKVVKE